MDQLFRHLLLNNLLECLMVCMRIICRVDRIQMDGPGPSRHQGENAVEVQAVKCIQQQDWLDALSRFYGELECTIKHFLQWGILFIECSFGKNGYRNALGKDFSEVGQASGPVFCTRPVDGHYTKSVQKSEDGYFQQFVFADGPEMVADGQDDGNSIQIGNVVGYENVLFAWIRDGFIGIGMPDSNQKKPEIPEKTVQVKHYIAPAYTPERYA